MAKTYSKVLLQFVFTPKNREHRFDSAARSELAKVIHGIATNKRLKPLAVTCMSDHVHVLTYMHTALSIGQVASYLKANSSRWINNQSWCERRFEWQSGYSVFSYSHWDKSKIHAYVNNQEEHHRRKTFRKEYEQLLTDFGIDYSSDDLFGD